MAQRWMQAKIEIGKRHGTTKSGANRATGDVWDDRKVGLIDETFKPITDHEPKRPQQKSITPTVWGKGRKFKRAMQKEASTDKIFLASSRIVL